MTMYLPERILIAPSGFKESLTAVEVAEAISCGIRRVLPTVRIDSFPVADGGEGSIDILATRPGTKVHKINVQGPVGAEVSAQWLEFVDHGIAVVEMAQSAGLSLVPRDMRDPGATCTYGVGQVIADVLNNGIRSIVVGCGDSGTSDGGAGALRALGLRILNSEGNEIARGGSALVAAAELDVTNIHPALAESEIVLACNMHNVLTGPQGVARVFGPQKGASPEQVEVLDCALETWASLLEHTFNPSSDLRGAGSGASGGLGAGLMAVGATAKNRFEVLLEDLPAGTNAGLSDLIRQADLIITAEGAIDFQTPKGKVPAEIARRAQLIGVPVLGLAGTLGKGAPKVHEVGVAAIESIMTSPMALEDAVENGKDLLIDAAERSMRMLQLGSVLAARSEDRQFDRYKSRSVA
ncbi:glycerate kinase [Corynebacterium felinum]|uniref:Glycerate kinase n=1 Tax=Corynebacterium felinum TaxID=131318 RepID=A0ABU2B9K9_9CORY|nr:glycerate kinase [Corynebacterium felinum]MDF5821894.1 glycerate kinase [Corynebacterium felinum]MDR7355293.1 glycerate kinase [Corynebacterium felinum]WJY94646.1 Glycerate 2-kinase [Corynebacterium felinum]